MKCYRHTCGSVRCESFTAGAVRYSFLRGKAGPCSTVYFRIGPRSSCNRQHICISFRNSFSLYWLPCGSVCRRVWILPFRRRIIGARVACSAFLGFRFREKIFLRIFQPVGYFKGARLFLRILRNGICLSGFGIYIDPPEKFFEGYTVVFAKNG